MPGLPASDVVVSSPLVTARMSRQRRRDTAPEIALRRRLHARGLRFRVDAPLPGLPRRRADVLFTRVRVAVFVDGCFWHACPVHGTAPQSNSTWWARKLSANAARDRATDAYLAELGWVVLRFWEHDDPDHAAEEIVRVWQQRRQNIAGTDTAPSSRGLAGS